MNIKRYIPLVALFFAGATLTSCEAFNEFLDVVPDNRTELDTEDKIIAMLVSAYSPYTYLTTCEFSSDNIDKLDIKNPVNELYIEELAMWQDVTEVQNDGPQNVWQGQYGAIASANEILSAIEEYGDDLTDRLKAAKGEALMCRAYAHFILANVFCQAYSPTYADSDLGLPYMFEAETTLNPKYERGTLAEFYAYMAADVEEGLTLITDNIASVPKYHFGVKSANAFAARFYLFYQDYDKAVECATKVLGSNPASDLRDLATNKAYGTLDNGYNLFAVLDYIDSSHKCNLLMATGMSQIGVAFGPYSAYTDFNHGSYLSATETILAATAPFGAPVAGDLNQLILTLNSSTYDKQFFPRVPYLFEYTDEVAGIGYPHTVEVLLTVDETLLVRAEAYAMSGNFAAAVEDINTWVGNYRIAGGNLTESSINSWADRTAYYEYKEPTVKKRFEDPAMTIASGTQENVLHVVAYLRRLETLHTGLRFFDMKRYGYTTYRRAFANTNTDKVPQTITLLDQLAPRDPRYAIQIPVDVISAGFEPNPR
ncbi:MAG: RagB/SusD family nutrient uptake outer membrane protein [Rikenellaceae bacterium]